MSIAYNIFLHQSLLADDLTSDNCLEQPNKETIAALLEAENIAHDPSVKRRTDVEEALRTLNA